MFTEREIKMANAYIEACERGGDKPEAIVARIRAIYGEDTDELILMSKHEYLTMSIEALNKTIAKAVNLVLAEDLGLMNCEKKTALPCGDIHYTYEVPLNGVNYNPYHLLRAGEIRNILSAEDPEAKLMDVLNARYEDSLTKKYIAMKKLAVDKLEDILESVVPEWIQTKVQQMVCDRLTCVAPVDYYRKNVMTHINIFIDAEASGLGYYVNSVYPQPFPAAILWLVQTMGRTKAGLYEALEIMYPKDHFLMTIKEEIRNTVTDTNSLVFILDMRLEDAILLHQAMRIEPDGYIVLDKAVHCGLFDRWNGRGSEVLGIELPQDITIPFSHIASALPDGMDGKGIRASQHLHTYAWWQPHMLKAIGCELPNDTKKEE